MTSYGMLPIAVPGPPGYNGYMPVQSYVRGPSTTTVILGLILLGVVGYLVYVMWLQPVPKPRRTTFARPQASGPQTVVPWTPGGPGAQGPMGSMGPMGPAGSMGPTPMTDVRVAMPPGQKVPESVKPVAVMSADSFVRLLGTMDIDEDEDSSKLSEDQIKALAAQRQAEIDRQNADFQARAGVPAAAAS